MEKRYSQCIKIWDEVFEKQQINIVTCKESGNTYFDQGMAWLCEKAKTVLDFGCGNGTALFLSALYGSTHHIGIDFSPKAIMRAKISALKMKTGKYNFNCAGVEALQKIADQSMDAIILSNVVDNLFPEDAKQLLSEVKRILRTNGRILIKLNPYISKEELKEWGVVMKPNNIIDDGLVLWNLSTTEWRNLISNYFVIEKYMDVPYVEQNQMNRMFLVTKLD